MYHYSFRPALIVSVLILVGLLALGTVSHAAPTDRTWQSRGIGGGGGLFAPTISPSDPDLIFMTTDMSSMFRSTDYGISWETLNHTKIQAGVDVHVRFTSDANVLFSIDLIGELRTPVKSTDGSQTWSALVGDPTGGEAYTLFTDLTSTQRLLVSSYSTLYISEDGGSTFRSVYSDSGGLYVAGVVWDGATIFVGTSDGLVVSVDNGQTFALVPTSGLPTGDVMVSFDGAREGTLVRLVCISASAGDVWPGWEIGGGMGDVLWSAGKIYRLAWGNSQWTLSTNGIANNDHPVFVRMTPGNADTVWVAGGDVDDYVPIVYKSTDGGARWTSVFSTDQNQNILTGWSGHGGDAGWWFGEYALGFAVSPTDSNRAVMTDLGYVHVTADGGSTWRQAYVDPRDENPAGAQTPSGRNYRGNGLQQTSCWWLHWTDPNSMIAAFTDIRGMRSTDGGISWTAGSALGLTQNSTYHVVQHPGTGRLYAATSTVHDLYQSTYLQDSRIDSGDGQVMVSEDNGATWQVLHDFNHPVVWLALDSDHPERLYASVVHSSQGDVYVTNNLSSGVGSTWNRLGSPPRTEGHPFNIHVFANGDLLAAYSGRRNSSGSFTTSSGIFLSNNSGSSWQDLSHSGMLRWTKDVVVDPNDATQNTWYVSVFSHWGSYPNEVGGLYRTTDRGQTWARISDLYRVDSSTVDPLDADTLYLSTEAQGLWVTQNLHSATPVFTQLTHYPFRQPVRIFFNPYDPEEVWVTSFGGGMRVSRNLKLHDVEDVLKVLTGVANTPRDLDSSGQSGLPDGQVTLQILNGVRE